jgi:hypothetical protein
METWTRTWQHGRGHDNMDEDMETWTVGHGNMESLTWKHGRGLGNLDEDRETENGKWKPW